MDRSCGEACPKTTDEEITERAIAIAGHKYRTVTSLSSKSDDSGLVYADVVDRRRAAIANPPITNATRASQTLAGSGVAVALAGVVTPSATVEMNLPVWSY